MKRLVFPVSPKYDSSKVSNAVLTAYDNNNFTADDEFIAAIQSRGTHKMMLVLCARLLLTSTNRLHLPLPPVTLVPISVSSKRLEQCVTSQWLCFGQIEALEAGSTSLFSTVDWTTSALWSLVRDSRRNCGLHTIMSAIFHSWVSWYRSSTAATTSQPWQAWLIAHPVLGVWVPEDTFHRLVTFGVSRKHTYEARAGGTV